jgi:hypothetical protein
MNSLEDHGRAARWMRRSAFLALTLATFAPVVTARAEDEPMFRIEFNDGKVTPQRLEVPAKTRFKLDLYNVGREPAEFESKEIAQGECAGARLEYDPGDPDAGSRRIRFFRRLSSGRAAGGPGREVAKEDARVWSTR